MVPMLRDDEGRSRGPAPETVVFAGARVRHVGESGGYKRTFDLELSGNTATVRRCYWMRGPAWKRTATDQTLTLEGTSLTLCAVINTLDNTVTLGTGYDAEVPATSDVVKVPLYELARATEEAAWGVELDARPGCVVLWV